jgi:hypothetical protein
MAQAVFQRIEKKFMLTAQQYDALKPIIISHMLPDQYTDYTICNLYFDTENFTLIRTSLEKPVYKEKLRLRSYDVPTDNTPVYLELKKKYKGIVYKRRIELSMREAQVYLSEGRYPKQCSSRQILKEIDYTLHFYSCEVQPVVFIAYDREAWAGKENPELRLTFDKNIRSRSNRLDLRAGDMGEPLLDADQILMEVKIPGAMPMWMAEALAELNVTMSSFSKYGEWYQQNMAARVGRQMKLRALREAQTARIAMNTERIRNYA